MNTYEAIYHLTRRLQLKNRFVSNPPEVGTSLVETHILIEIQADPKHSISSLAELMAVHQSTMSRAISSLEKRGYLKKQSLGSDSRRSVLRLSPKGAHKLSLHDNTVTSLIQSWLTPLSKAERKRIPALWREIANGFNMKHAKPRAIENHHRVEQRRMTRAFGLLGDSAFHSGHSSLEWQILYYIGTAPFPSTPSEISDFLLVPGNSVSTSITKLTKEGLIARKSDLSDKRVAHLECTPKGKSLLARIASGTGLALEKALKGVSHKNVAAGVKALARFIDGYEDGISHPLPFGYSIREISDKMELQQLRAKALRWIVERNHEEYIGESILSSSSRNYILELNAIPKAGVEVSKKGVVVLAAWSSDVHDNLLFFCMEHISSREGVLLNSKRNNFAPLSRFYIKFKPT